MGWGGAARCHIHEMPAAAPAAHPAEKLATASTCPPRASDTVCFVYSYTPPNRAEVQNGPGRHGGVGKRKSRLARKMTTSASCPQRPADLNTTALRATAHAARQRWGRKACDLHAQVHGRITALGTSYSSEGWNNVGVLTTRQG
jgi:hypothetical protein